MSQPNEETVRRVYERLNRGDVAGVVEVCDDDMLMDFSERVFNPDTYRGPDGIRRFYEGVKEIWQSYQWEVEGTRVAGDSVVALLHCHAEGRQGGPPVDWRVAWLWRFRDGRPVFLRFYRERARALEDAGLGE
jgi:ketosteroid isomerase-like protein